MDVEVKNSSNQTQRYTVQYEDTNGKTFVETFELATSQEKSLQAREGRHVESSQSRNGGIMRLFILLAIVGLSAGCGVPEKSRYEIETTSVGGSVVHLCDTWTGQVWQYSRSENRWEPFAALENPQE